MSEQRSAISLTGGDLVLRFPGGDYTDTFISDLVASRRGSTAGEVHVTPWSEGRIAAWQLAKGRFDRYGRRVRKLIIRVGRSPYGDGFVQHVATRLQVPLTDPPKSSTFVTRCTVDGRGWLDNGAAFHAD